MRLPYSAAATAAIAFLLSAPAGAVNFILEVHDPIGADFFARYVYACPACSVADHEAVTPPAGITLQRAAQGLYDSSSVVFPSIPGVASGYDLVPGIPGDDYLLVAEVLGGSIIELAIPNVFGLIDVQRDTVLTWNAGSVVHEVIDPDGNIYVLFSFDLLLAPGIDPTLEGALAGTPLPTGWTHRSRTLTEALAVDSGGLAKVFSQNFAGNSNSWQRYATLPEPGSAALAVLGLAWAWLRRRDLRAR